MSGGLGSRTTGSIFTAIEEARSRDDVVEPYADEVREFAAGLGHWDDDRWKRINEAIVARWSPAALTYIKRKVWLRIGSLG